MAVLTQVFLEEQHQPLPSKFAFNVVIAIFIAAWFVAVSVHHLAVSSSYASVDKEAAGTRNAACEGVTKAWFFPNL